MDAQPIRVRGVLRGHAVILDGAIDLRQGSVVSVEIVPAPLSPEDDARG